MTQVQLLFLLVLFLMIGVSQGDKHQPLTNLKQIEKRGLDTDVFPCPWRNRVFDIYTNGSLVTNITFSPDGMFLSIGGQPDLKLLKLLGTFLILKYPDGAYVCFRIDSDQSNKNTFVIRNGFIRRTANICLLCDRNGESNLLEGVAQDSDIDPKDPESLDQFCDSPKECKTKTVQCKDNGSFESIGGCPS